MKGLTLKCCLGPCATQNKTCPTIMVAPFAGTIAMSVIASSKIPSTSWTTSMAKNVSCICFRIKRNRLIIKSCKLKKKRSSSRHLNLKAKNNIDLCLSIGKACTCG